MGLITIINGSNNQMRYDKQEFLEMKGKVCKMEFVTKLK